MKKLAILLVLISAPALAQPRGSIPPQRPQVQSADQPITSDLLNKIVADAQAADADAKSNNDTIASTCYEAIIAVAQTRLQTVDLQGAGLLTAFQKVRDLNRLNASPLGTQLIVGCAPLVQDAKLNFLQFFTNIGAVVLLKGILPIP